MPPAPGNPNHPVVRRMESEWHKLCAIIMHKYREQLGDRVVITPEDIQAFIDDKVTNIVCNEKVDGIHLFLVDDAAAAKLVDVAGGKAF